jgi:hypothetical protein
LDLGVDVIKNFIVTLTIRKNKLDRLSKEDFTA